MNLKFTDGGLPAAEELAASHPQGQTVVLEDEER